MKWYFLKNLTLSMRCTVDESLAIICVFLKVFIIKNEYGSVFHVTLSSKRVLTYIFSWLSEKTLISYRTNNDEKSYILRARPIFLTIFDGKILMLHYLSCVDSTGKRMSGLKFCGMNRPLLSYIEKRRKFKEWFKKDKNWNSNWSIQVKQDHFAG